MKKKTVITILSAVLILALGVGVGVYAASNFGTQSDPLVAKSYLDDVLTPKLQAQFESQLSTKSQELEQRIESVKSTVTGNYGVVTLKAGATLTGDAGCEIILRSGSASANAASGLSDVTSGSSVSNAAAIEKNHLCMVGTNGEGVKAGSTGATLLVRGTYKLG